MDAGGWVAGGVTVMLPVIAQIRGCQPPNPHPAQADPGTPHQPRKPLRGRELWDSHYPLPPTTTIGDMFRQTHVVVWNRILRCKIFWIKMFLQFPINAKGFGSTKASPLSQYRYIMNKNYKKLVSNLWRDLTSDKKLARPSHNSKSVPQSQLKKCAPSHNSKSVPQSQLKKCDPVTTQKVCPSHNSNSVPLSQLNPT